MEHWNNAFIDFPPMDRHYRHLSIEVDARTISGKIHRAFCDCGGNWYDANSQIHKIQDKVVAWKLVEAAK